MENYQIEKITRLLMGEKIICSDNDIDAFNKIDELYNKKLVSIYNPNQCGVLDRYIAWLKDPKL